MKKKVIFAVIAMLALFSNTATPVMIDSKQVNKQKLEKEPVIKITNSNKIITTKTMEKIDPKTIKSIDVHPDTIFITLKEVKSKVAHKKKTEK